MEAKTTMISTVKALLEAHRAQAAIIDRLMLEVIKQLQAGTR